MGGMGSGSDARHVTVESSFRLTVAQVLDAARQVPALDGVRRFRATMAREGGRLCRATNAIDMDVSVGPETGFVRLRYTATRPNREAVPIDERVGLASLPQPFGVDTVQWYLVCPFSGRRAKALFLPWGAVRFGCRERYRLTYTSQRQSPRDRALTVAQDIRIAVGGPDYSAIWEEFPPRPPGMRRRRYERLRERAEAAADVSFGLLNDRFDRIDKTLGRVRAKLARCRLA